MTGSAGTGVKLAAISLAAIIASFMTEGMTAIPCYLIVCFFWSSLYIITCSI
jgi:hypothetical protein